MRDIDVEKRVLENGLSVITVYKETPLFFIGAGIRAGSLYEDEKNNGVSHMVEHMLFKGTKDKDMNMISDMIEGLAGDFDIYTTYDETILTAGTMKHNTERCVEIISDMLMNSCFPVNEFRMEKKVVIEEIKMEKDDLEENAYLGLYKTAFPLEWHKFNIAGTIKTVRSMKIDDVLEFYKKFYIPGNTAICTVSSNKHEEMQNMISRYFMNWRGGMRQQMPKRNQACFGKKFISRKKGIGQAHILYGFDIRGLDRKEEVALLILNKKIGSGANSILFKELRDSRGYAYNVYSDIDFVDGIKMMYIYTAVSKENIKNTVSIIDDVYNRFREGSIALDDDAVSLIKQILITENAIAMESHVHIIDYLLEGELKYGNPLEYQDVLSTLDSISKEDIIRTAQKVLKNPVVYIISPR